MNILDENIVSSTRRWLEARRIHFRQIGIELGRPGMKDRDEIIPLLHSLRNPTFLPGIGTSTRPSYAARHTASFFWTLLLMRLPSSSAAHYGTKTFARTISEWDGSYEYIAMD